MKSTGDGKFGPPVPLSPLYFVEDIGYESRQTSEKATTVGALGATTPWTRLFFLFINDQITQKNNKEVCRASKPLQFKFPHFNNFPCERKV